MVGVRCGMVESGLVWSGDVRRGKIWFNFVVRVWCCMAGLVPVGFRVAGRGKVWLNTLQ